MAISAEQTMLELARHSLDEGKCQDLTELDVRELTAVTDHMLICSGTSARHVKSLAENLVKAVKEIGKQPIGVEGLTEGEWVLVDLGDTVVHVMQPSIRAFYQLEKLWTLGPEMPDQAGQDGLDADDR